MIDGVRCRVLMERLFGNGRLTERTRDYYAQTKAGTVWYFGEDTAELDRNGNVISREGSFLSGKDGAEAGVFMPDHPRVSVRPSTRRTIPAMPRTDSSSSASARR